jgi:hypothetical protein
MSPRAHPIHAPHVPHVPHVTLNTDGHPHPRENTLTIVTFALGAIALICAVVGVHPLGAAVGLAGMVIGAYAQLVSATTAERWLIVFGAGASFVGFGVNLAFGGF